MQIVIVLSASSHATDVAAAYALGANAFLTKPAEIAKLVEMVRAIGDFWLKQNIGPAPRAPVALSSIPPAAEAFRISVRVEANDAAVPALLDRQRVSFESSAQICAIGSDRGTPRRPQIFPHLFGVR